jgi:hypothetical protein
MESGEDFAVTQTERERLGRVESDDTSLTTAVPNASENEMSYAGRRRVLDYPVVQIGVKIAFRSVRPYFDGDDVHRGVEMCSVAA